jgi:hypothetical protein
MSEEEIHPVLSELLNRISDSGFGDLTDDVSGVAQMPARDYRQEPLEFEDLNNQCCVCYRNPDKIDFIKSECGHNYCNTCFFTWLKQSPTCAMCRHNFTDWRELEDDELEPMYSSLKRQYKKKRNLLKNTLFKIHKLEERIEIKKGYNKLLFSRQLRLNYLRQYTEGYNLGFLESGGRENELVGEYRRGYIDGTLDYHKKYCGKRKVDCVCDYKMMAHKSKERPEKFDFFLTETNRKITIKQRRNSLASEETSSTDMSQENSVELMELSSDEEL